MKHAFSLVELSIVLVILGLLTGGILGGQSLIRTAELRAVSTEYDRYTTAISTFRDKYFALPGDMTNAQSFWTAAATCPGVAGTAAAGVCNGDGNGRVEPASGTSNELFGSWEHLALAGLVEGNYTGNTSHAATAADPSSTLGTNLPRSKLSNAGWALYSLGTIPISDVNWFDSNYGNMFFFGGASANNLPLNPILKPEEAWNLDTKMDDGRPATGRILSSEQHGSAAGTGCTNAAASNSASLASSTYSLNNQAISCILLVKTSY